MGQSRHRSRHCRLPRREHPALVARPRPAPLSHRHTVADHRRLRRQQRRTGPAVEARVAGLRRRDRAVGHGGPPAAGHQQVEPDRASGLFAFITQTWRGKPLLTHQVIVPLIASTPTRTGLTVRCRLDRSPYAKGVRVSDAEMATLNLRPAAFHGDWNYTIRPRQPTD